jgi:hypothetical protein
VRQLSVLFLGLALSLRSYYVRELLVCWLFLSLMFVSLTLLILVGLLAARAGNLVFLWASTAWLGTSTIALSPAELPAKVIPVGGKKNPFSTDQW